MLASTTRLVFAVGLLGCTGEIEEDIPDGISPEQEAARKAWVVNAQPTLDKNCASCHGGSMPAVAWLEGSPDINAQKEDLLTYAKPLVDFNAPQTSMLIKKGAHDGPALTASQTSGIVDWITKEREATPAMSDYPIQTAPLVLMPCTAGAPGEPTCPYNEILLDAHGAAGAKVQFTAANLNGQLYLSSIKVVPGPMGAYVEHPLFVSVPAMGEPKVDPLDRYASVKLNLAAGAAAAMQQLGSGTASFPGFVATDPLSLYAKVIGPMMAQ